MEREIFKSHPLRGIPIGLVRGFMYGCLILLISLALGMDEDLFIPLLVVFVILCGIIGMISGIGKSITADGNGIYVKNKAYLFAENNMYMQVHTHYYNCIPVTERWIDIVGRDCKHKVKCSFLSGQDAGRLAKIIEDGMRKKGFTSMGRKQGTQTLFLFRIKCDHKFVVIYRLSCVFYVCSNISFVRYCTEDGFICMRIAEIYIGIIMKIRLHHKRPFYIVTGYIFLDKKT